MKDIHPPRLRRRLSGLLLPIALLLAGASAHAAVIVAGTATLDAGSGVYTYSYTVTNTNSTFDIAEIDIPIGASAVITNATAPTGFDIISDGDPINLVSFLEDFDPGTTTTFSPGSTSGIFSYQSTTAPLTVTFSALDANGDTYTGSTIAAVPEASAPLATMAAVLPLLVSRRRRNVA